jgi:hypothetical protein
MIKTLFLNFNKITLYLSLLLSLLVIPALSQAQNDSKQIRGNELTEICMAYAEMGGPEVDQGYCQCKNDLYRGFLTASDWVRATTDYVVFMTEHQGNNINDYLHNSYEQKLERAGGACTKSARGKEKIAGVPGVENYEDIYNNLLNGNFDAVSKNGSYPVFFMDFVFAYSDACREKFDGIVYTRTSQLNVYSTPTVHEVKVKHRLLDTYLTYESRVKINTIGEMFKKKGEAQKRGDLSGFMTGMMASFARAKAASDYVENKFSAGCYDPEIKTLDENIYRFENSLEPISLPAGLQNKQSKDMAQKNVDEEKAHKEKIIAMLKASEARQKKIYSGALEKESLDASMGKDGKLVCDMYTSQSQATKTDMKNTLRNKITGSWTGKIGSNLIELVLWKQGGIINFPGKSCLMSSGLSYSSSTMPGPDGAYHDYNSVLIGAQPISFRNSELFRGNCQAFTTPLLGSGINGFAKVEAGGPLVWYLYDARLGDNTPTNCDAVKFTFKPSARAAPEVIKALEEATRETDGYKRHWIPSAEFLNSLK